MIKNKVLNKCCSMLVALIVTLSLILPSMLMPQEVNAGTDSVTLNIRSNPSGGFRASGKSNQRLFTEKGEKFRNSSGKTL